MFKYLNIQDLLWVLQLKGQSDRPFKVKWGTERLTDLLKVTEQVSGEVQIIGIYVW